MVSSLRLVAMKCHSALASIRRQNPPERILNTGGRRSSGLSLGDVRRERVGGLGGEHDGGLDTTRRGGGLVGLEGREGLGSGGGSDS